MMMTTVEISWKQQTTLSHNDQSTALFFRSRNKQKRKRGKNNMGSLLNIFERIQPDIVAGTESIDFLLAALSHCNKVNVIEFEKYTFILWLYTLHISCIYDILNSIWLTFSPYSAGKKSINIDWIIKNDGFLSRFVRLL